MRVISPNDRASLCYAPNIADMIRSSHPEKEDSIRKEYSIMSQIALKYVDLLTAVRGLLMKGYTVDKILSIAT